jgi:hypothetical protein
VIERERELWVRKIVLLLTLTFEIEAPHVIERERQIGLPSTVSNLKLSHTWRDNSHKQIKKAH